MVQEGRLPGRGDACARVDGRRGKTLRFFVQALSTETTTTQMGQASSHHSPPLRLTAAAPEGGSCAEDSPRDTVLELE